MRQVLLFWFRLIPWKKDCLMGTCNFLTQPPPDPKWKILFDIPRLVGEAWPLHAHLGASHWSLREDGIWVQSYLSFCHPMKEESSRDCVGALPIWIVTETLVEYNLMHEKFCNSHTSRRGEPTSKPRFGQTTTIQFKHTSDVYANSPQDETEVLIPFNCGTHTTQFIFYIPPNPS